MAPHTRVGIDFGTSNTIAVVARPGHPVVPLLFDGSPVLPSAVFASDGRLLVGRDAERASMSDPARFEPNPKRCMVDGTVLLGESEYPVVRLVGAVLERVRDELFRVLGGLPETVIMTHPAGWGAERLRVLSAAARQAGLPMLRLVPEPVAAATHFSLHLGHRIPDGGHIVVYDLGGGTFDVSVVRCGEGTIQVVATAGLPDIGGVDIDHAIVTHLVETFPIEDDAWDRLRYPSSPSDRRHRRALWRDVRDAKEILSRESSASLFVPLLDKDALVTRSELEDLARPLLNQTVELTVQMLDDAGVEPAALAGLFLVGGASRMPLASTLLLRETRVAPTVLEQPELVVASGAVDAPTNAPPDPVGPYESVTMVGPIVAMPSPRPAPFRGVARVPVRPVVSEAMSVAGYESVPVATSDPHSHSEDEPLREMSASIGISAEVSASAEAAPEPVEEPEPQVVADVDPPGDDPVNEESETVEDHEPAPESVGEEEPDSDPVEDRELPPTIRGVASVPLPREPVLVNAGPATLLDNHSGIAVVALRGQRYVAAAFTDGVGVFDVGAGFGRVLAFDVPGVTSMAWEPDQGDLIAVADGPTIRLWRAFDNGTIQAEPGNPVRTLGGPGEVRYLSWGTAGLAVGHDGEILVWNPSTAECVRTWRFSSGPHDPIRALAWSPDGMTLASGGVAGTLKLWSPDSDVPVLNTTTQPVAIRAMAWSPDGERLAAGDAGGSVQLWTISDGDARDVGKAHDAAVTVIAWSGDAALVATGGIDGRVRVIDAATGTLGVSMDGHSRPVTAVWFDGDALFSAAGDDRIRIWDPSTGESVI